MTAWGVKLLQGLAARQELVVLDFRGQGLSKVGTAGAVCFYCCARLPGAGAAKGGPAALAACVQLRGAHLRAVSFVWRSTQPLLPGSGSKAGSQDGRAAQLRMYCCSVFAAPHATVPGCIPHMQDLDPTAELSVEGMAADIIEFMNATGLERPNVLVSGRKAGLAG